VARVNGIGGIFFKARDPKKLGAWYKAHLGIPLEDWGGTQFRWRRYDTPDRSESTVWNLFKEDSTYFDPGSKSFMVNYIVDDLAAVLAQLRAEGVTVDDRVDESEFGKFGWASDPEGNRFELWEPPTS
jgi:catechol 2,3-dioxygenase-like lactoylglutathione lyase family enzyme